MSSFDGQLNLFSMFNIRKYEPVSEKRFKDRWYIARVEYDTAMDLVVKNHYMHRVCPCSMAFGLIDDSTRGGGVQGVITYGVPCSSTLLKGVCGEEEEHNVYELNRLWIDDDVPNNAESFLVGNTLRLLDKEIVVSFSDTSVGHVGYIYQATNFYYCGLSAAFKDIRVRGFEGKHHATFAHGMTAEQVIQTYGEENCYWVDRPRKHRYVFFNADKRRKRELLKKLKYKIEPYPKGNVVRHEIDETYGY